MGDSDRVMNEVVLLTGGSGFVGSAIARALLGAGYRVRALVRPSSPRNNLAGLDLEMVDGDICDTAAVRKAMRGAQRVAHAAADYRLWTRDPAALVRANVEGTRTVMEAALAEGVPRVVYTSSVATLRPRHDGGAASEADTEDEAGAIGAYKRSKVAAERVVEAIARRGLAVVIVNPSTPIGPRDIKPTPTGRVIVEAARGRMPAFVDTGMNLVHVDDVAAGHVAALERGKPGERYILGGDDVPLREMLAEIAALTGRRPPRFQLPRAPLFPLATAAEAIAAVTGREPLLTRDALRMSRHRMFFTSEKAMRELGYRPRPHAAGLRDAVEWRGKAG
jgi:hopanoid-associated sugar epimerase